MDEDAITTAAESNNFKVAEELLKYFVEQKNAAVLPYNRLFLHIL
jgi:hypothetical protein